jgi:hypothetical protein
MSDAQSSTTVHTATATTPWSSSTAGRERGHSRRCPRIEPPPWSSSASAHPLDLLPLFTPAPKTEKKAAPDVEAVPEVPPTCPAPPAMDAAEGVGEGRERRGSRRASREEVAVGHAWGAAHRPGRGRAPGRERMPGRGRVAPLAWIWRRPAVAPLASTDPPPERAECRRAGGGAILPPPDLGRCGEKEGRKRGKRETGGEERDRWVPRWLVGMEFEI